MKFADSNVIDVNLGYMTGLEDDSILQKYSEIFVTVQFIHRCFGWATAIAAWTLAVVGWKLKYLLPRQRMSLISLGVIATLQFILGILTLIHIVPVPLASMHQMGACLLLLASVHAAHVFREHPVLLRAMA